MKVCEKCEEEIFTRDGENLCEECEKRARRNARQRERARAKRAVMESLGMKRVRGNLGGTYWE